MVKGRIRYVEPDFEAEIGEKILEEKRYHNPYFIATHQRNCESAFSTKIVLSHKVDNKIWFVSFFLS